MKIISKSSNGFTAVELLVTLFIAAAFLMSGYQLYDLIMKDGGDTRAQARASNATYDYLQQYKALTTIPCTSQTPLTNQSVTVDGLSTATMTVVISCPYASNPNVSKVLATIKYNSPQQTVSNATYTTNSTAAAASSCPTGFINVPGSATYGTSDFCVMKYEASRSDATAVAQGTSTIPVSTAGVQPWVDVNRSTSISYAPNVAGCTGCHLITLAEWLTIAQNVLSVPSNWSSGTVGSGYMFSGHNDLVPNNAVVTSSNDSDGYYLTGNFSGDSSVNLYGVVGNSQRRTLTLSNGQIIWDLSGNLTEWTSYLTGGVGNQPGINGMMWENREWTAITNPGTMTPNISPATTGIFGASTWNSTKGIGRIYSSSDTGGAYAIAMGCGYNCPGAGVLNAYINLCSTCFGSTSQYTFRVTK
ncbi:MAG: hypothetical protein WCH58_00345 [Candidatus Saccharibacteria bacterium]